MVIPRKHSIEGACKICGQQEKEFRYKGQIRMGRFGDWSNEDFTLNCCGGCGVVALPNQIGKLDDYYESSEYRQDVDRDADLNHFFKLHDVEQLRNFGITGTDKFRGKVVADIGCGAGSFLDFVTGPAAELIAVEPNRNFRDNLHARGFHTFDYAHNAAQQWAGKVDLTTCFSTVEHIEDPLQFVQEIYALLKPGGRLVISTPNAADVLLASLPVEYGRFFYRKVHLWYWDAASFQYLIKTAGFNDTKVIPHHRFGLSNYLNWLREKQPKGDARLDYVSPTMDQVWRSELERMGTCDYLYLEAVK